VKIFNLLSLVQEAIGQVFSQGCLDPLHLRIGLLGGADSSGLVLVATLLRNTILILGSTRKA
jgi:hypothetical protein